jgi:hypothetical protein
MTEYKLNHFTMGDAQALAGKTADITEWDNDELETKVTYPGARITGIIVLSSPCLVIETAGAVITDAQTGERLGTRPPEPELRLFFTWICEVDGVRSRFERGDRVALEHTDDPDTRLRPGDEGTVTRYDPKPGQLSDHRVPFDASELVFSVTDMSVTLTAAQVGRPMRGSGKAVFLPCQRQDREHATGRGTVALPLRLGRPSPSRVTAPGCYGREGRASLLNLPQADDHRAKRAGRYCAVRHLKC